MANDLLDLARDLASAVRDRRRLVTQYRGHRLGRRLALESAPAGDDLVEDEAERKNVRAVIGWKTARLLGRQIPHRAEHHAGARQRRRGSRAAFPLDRRAPCEAEVEDLDVPVLSDEDVFGFQVAVHDPALVRGRKSLSDLQSPVDGAHDADLGCRQTVAQRGAFEELHDGEHGAVDVADVMDGD